MATTGLFLSSEEQGPKEFVHYAQLGEQAGLGSVLISDHFHPWTERRGQSPFRVSRGGRDCRGDRSADHDRRPARYRGAQAPCSTPCAGPFAPRQAS